MKQILQIIGVGICSSMLLIGCASTKPTKTIYSFSEYRAVQTSQTVATAPLIADLVVSEKRVNYAERINTVISEMSASEAKALADKEKETVIANAVKANKADVLVAPIIDIQTDANGYLVIEVTGYPASYKKFGSKTRRKESRCAYCIAWQEKVIEIYFFWTRLAPCLFFHIWL